MQLNKQYNMLSYLITLLLAMCLIILPLPAFLSSVNPDWVLLALIYWVLAIPEKIGVFNAWFVGMFVDILTGRILGLHALSYALISYVCLTFHKRLRQYPIAQQSLFVFFCLFFSQMLVFWIQNIQGVTEFTLAFWGPVLSGALFWPLVYFTFYFIRIFGRIS